MGQELPAIPFYASGATVVSSFRLPAPILLAAATLAAGLSPLAAPAQVIRGSIIDAATGDGIAAAYVAILDTGGVAVGGGATGADGRFALQVPRRAVYRLRASRLGYDGAVSAPIDLGSGADGSVLLRLAPTPVELPSLTVEANARVARLEDVGFYRRRAMGFGHLLAPEEIVAKNAVWVSDLLRGMAGVRVIGNPGSASIITRASSSMFLRGQCWPSIVLDGYIVSVGGLGGGGSLDRFLSPHDIEALEVYPGPAGVPVQYSGYMSPCGAILIWRRR